MTLRKTKKEEKQGKREELVPEGVFPGRRYSRIQLKANIRPLFLVSHRSNLANLHRCANIRHNVRSGYDVLLLLFFFFPFFSFFPLSSNYHGFKMHIFVVLYCNSPNR